MSTYKAKPLREALAERLDSPYGRALQFMRDMEDDGSNKMGFRLENLSAYVDLICTISHKAENKEKEPAIFTVRFWGSGLIETIYS